MTSDCLSFSTGAMRLRRSSNQEDKRLDKGMLRMQAGWAVQMLEVWGRSVAVIDEVDIVRAHPHLAPPLAVGTFPFSVHAHHPHLAPPPLRACACTPPSFGTSPSPCLCMHTTLSLPRTLIWQVLHPLKSELNWPLGDKHALDFAPKRWEP